MNNEPFGSDNQQNENPDVLAGAGAPNSYLYLDDQPKKTDGFGIAALVTGIISLLCCCMYPVAWLIGVLGIVFAIISRKKMGEFSGMAIAGLVCAVIGTVISCFLLGSVIFTLIVDPEGFWQAFEEGYNAGLNGV
ncbi:MAG: DUF4190 domain-containing protein [Clostridia bacterium]|nr:DUF4190 domain-containing protein [Clostridia bacterium]